MDLGANDMLLSELKLKLNKLFRDEYEVLRCPKRLPKCYDMTEEERQKAIMKLNRNVWNDHNLTKQDTF